MPNDTSPGRQADTSLAPHGQELVIATSNLEQGGIDPDGATTRFANALSQLAEIRPNIVAMQEARGTSEWIKAAEQLLRMTCVQAPNGSGRHRTAVFVDTTIFADPSEEDVFAHSPLWKIAPTDVTLRLRESPDIELAVVSWHMSFGSPTQRQFEVENLAGLMDKIKLGKRLIMGGDCNELPFDPAPRPQHPWHEVTDAQHRTHRAVPTADGGWDTITYTDRFLLNNEMQDFARVAASKLDQADALAPTAGHAPGAAGQGGPVRIDRLYGSPQIAKATRRVEVVDLGEDVTDHKTLVVTLDKDAALGPR